jgi:riboflavin kinase/FMN adenylyltransferase
MAEPDGFSVVVVPSKLVKLHTGQSVRVSSTTIRYMLQSGHVADAAFLFGRPYRLIGKIIPGRGKGRQLGFPTLNMQMPSQIIPQEGVYAGYGIIGDSEENVCISKDHFPSVFSIGHAVTFGDQHSQLIEAHVLDANLGDMSGKWLSMDFVDRIRTQRRFESPEVLAAQIAKDCDSAKQTLSAKEAKK